MLTLNSLHKDVITLSDPIRKEVSQQFFKTGKGQYAEGDIFLGLTVPDCRKLALKYRDLSVTLIKQLLASKIHEERLIALLLLVQKFQKGTDDLKKEIFDIYLDNTEYINNWDLVDLSAPKIVGEYFLSQQGKRAGVPHTLVQLAHSQNLWEKRIAILSTFQFICKEKNEKPTFKIAKILLEDRHDLIQKALGWMLREVGKRVSQKTEREFLDTYYNQMGRTALRYAIEHFDEDLRQRYLKGKV